jgi:alpha-L-arabinofuranosidase
LPWYHEDDGVTAEEIIKIGLAGVGTQLGTYFQEFNELIYELTGRNIPVAITEFNGSYTDNHPNPYLRYTLGNALINAEFIRQLMHTDNIALANNQLFSNAWWGMVRGYDKPYTLRPNYYVFDFYNHHFGDILIDAQADCRSRRPNDCAYSTNGGYMVLPEDKVPYLTVNASKSSDGEKIYLMVVNKDMRYACNVQITLNGFDPFSVRAWTLNGDSIEAHNERGLNVYVTQNIIGSVTNGFTVTFLAHSFTAIEIQ